MRLSWILSTDHFLLADIENVFLGNQGEKGTYPRKRTLIKAESFLDWKNTNAQSQDQYFRLKNEHRDSFLLLKKFFYMSGIEPKECRTLFL